MRTTIKLTVTRPDGVPFDKAVQINPEDSPAARDINWGMFQMAFEKLTMEFDGWVDGEYGKYRPSPIEEIDLAIRHAKNERKRK